MSTISSGVIPRTYFHLWFGLCLTENVSPSRSGKMRATGNKSFLASTLLKSQSASGHSNAEADIGLHRLIIWKRRSNSAGASSGGRWRWTRAIDAEVVWSTWACWTGCRLSGLESFWPGLLRRMANDWIEHMVYNVNGQLWYTHCDQI